MFCQFVVEGDYKTSCLDEVEGVPILVTSNKKILLNKSNVEKYELVDAKFIADENVVMSNKMHELLTGEVKPPVLKEWVYWVMIYFNDGKKSLIRIDDYIYRAIKNSLG